MIFWVAGVVGKSESLERVAVETARVAQLNRRESMVLCCLASVQ